MVQTWHFTTSVKASPGARGGPSLPCLRRASSEWICPGQGSPGFPGSAASCILQPGTVSVKPTKLLGLTQGRSHTAPGLQTVHPLSPLLSQLLHELVLQRNVYSLYPQEHRKGGSPGTAHGTQALGQDRAGCAVERQPWTWNSPSLSLVSSSVGRW